MRLFNPLYFLMIVKWKSIEFDLNFTFLCKCHGCIEKMQARNLISKFKISHEPLIILTSYPNNFSLRMFQGIDLHKQKYAILSTNKSAYALFECIVALTKKLKKNWISPRTTLFIFHPSIPIYGSWRIVEPEGLTGRRGAIIVHHRRLETRRNA